MKDTCCLLLSVVVGLATGGCLVDRGPLAPADEEGDAGRDEADASHADAFVDSTIDAGPDAASGPSLDAFVDDAFVDDASNAPDAFEPCTSACDGAALVTCAGRSTETREDCKLGCGETPTPHCRRMLTSNFGSSSLFDLGTTPLVVSSPTTIDTATMGTRVSQRDGTMVARLVYSSIDISSTLTVTGPVPLVLIARDGVTITGAIELSASGATPGPGGYAGATSDGADAPGLRNGRGGAHEGSYDDAGGGGGGMCGGGGDGGRGGSAGGGNGSGRTDLTRDVESLRGGGGGGAGAGRGGSFGSGGGGAGAIQISTRGTVRIDGAIRARGGAARGGGDSGGHLGAGGGGGAGGFVLVEAPTVMVAGSIDAPGGPGGGGRDGGGGAAGGGISSDGSNGGDDTSSWGNGGGGGGGAGCVVIRTQDAFSAPTTISPRDAVGLRTLPLLTD
jgi:hypothetical protein